MADKNLESYLTFRLKGDLFALSVHKVLEIIETGEEHHITHLPKAAATISGVVNFRGNVIPVLDTRMKFDLGSYTTNDKYVVMVLSLKVNGESHFIGAMADKVIDVIEIDGDDIKPIPEVGKGYNSEFINGVVHKDDRFIMLLNLETAIATEEIAHLKTDQTSDVSLD